MSAFLTDSTDIGCVIVTFLPARELLMCEMSCKHLLAVSRFEPLWRALCDQHPAFATSAMWCAVPRELRLSALRLPSWRCLYRAMAQRGSLLRLLGLYVFVAIFWSLYDQSGSAWVQQADHMDRRFLGVEWLSSQLQALALPVVHTCPPSRPFCTPRARSRTSTISSRSTSCALSPGRSSNDRMEAAMSAHCGYGFGHTALAPASMYFLRSCGEQKHEHEMNRVSHPC